MSDEQTTPAEGVADSESSDNSGKEAQALRRRLREAEAQRDALAERVAGFQAADVTRLAGEKLAVADDLFKLGGVELADLMDESGNVSADKVSEAADAILADRPALASKPAAPGSLFEAQGARGSAASGGAPSWSSLFAG
jgi:hypothetical protein